MPTHVNLYSQPHTGVTLEKSLNYPPHAQNGNPSFGGTFVQYSQGGYVPQALASSNIHPYNGFIYPAVTPSNNYPFYTQPIYIQPNISAYPNPGSVGLFAYPTRCVTLFVHWIEDYPLADRLKMPSHVGSYDGKEDPDNYLHLFERVIRMQKWAMPVAWLHEDQCISGFVHGLRTRSMVEFLSTDLPTTYKCLMEKTYTWIEAREVATNGAPNDQREGFDRHKKNPFWDNNKG
ncbi:hypothetical protein Tco_0930737 [Tanacetum coccineum]